MVTFTQLVGYLIDQFLSPIWNHRTDEYGGTPEKNVKFATDIVDAIHRGAGNDFPVIFRLSLDHRIPGGRTLEDSKVILKVLAEHGVDAFDIDAGCYETIKYVYPPMYMGAASMEYICKSAREATDKPLLNQCKAFLHAGAVKIGSRISVIHQNFQVGVAMLGCVPG